MESSTSQKKQNAPLREVTIPAASAHHGQVARLIVRWACIHCGAPRGTLVTGESVCPESGSVARVSAWASTCGHRESYQEVREDFGL